MLFLLVVSLVFGQIQRVEPAFWWKGMKNPELQILVYGKNIAQYQVGATNQVPVTNITKVENPNYQFERKKSIYLFLRIERSKSKFGKSKFVYVERCDVFNYA